MDPYVRRILRDLSEDAPHLLRHFSKHRRTHGFARFVGNMMDEAAGFRHGGYRSARKLGADDLQLLLLALIAERSSHGYDLIKLLEERSGGFYVPSPGMVYPALTYLEEAGYATVEPEGTKKLYRITEQGQAYLERNRAAVDALMSQLAAIARRMGEQRRPDADDDDDQVRWGRGHRGRDHRDHNHHENNELRQARRHLRGVLRDLEDVSPEEGRRIAEILRRAASDIVAKR
jgi:DNA-binding PadR family transcriptional regulator